MKTIKAVKEFIVAIFKGIRIYFDHYVAIVFAIEDQEKFVKKISERKLKTETDLKTETEIYKIKKLFTDQLKEMLPSVLSLLFSLLSLGIAILSLLIAIFKK